MTADLEAARDLKAAPDLKAVLRCARDAAVAAGRTLAPRLGHPGRIRQKSTGPVTESDLRAERVALATIRRVFPHHAVLSEEAGAKGSDSNRWIIDPLDGTINFIHGIPWYDVSIAYESLGRVLVGVVYAPTLDLLFTAVRGRGAHLNGRRIHASRRRSLAGSMVDAGLGQDDWADDAVAKRLARLSRAGVNVRSINACGLDLAYVAAGWLDGYWDTRVSPWDLAAGSLLVREAGGRVTTWTRDDVGASISTVVASNGPLHDRLRRLVAASGNGRDRLSSSARLSTRTPRGSASRQQ